MIVHILGNSHVRNFIGHTTDGDRLYEENILGTDVKVLQLGLTGATIYALPNDGTTTNAGKKIREHIGSHEIENLLIVLGDVDVREHLYKHGPLVATIDETIQRFEDFLKQNTSSVKRVMLVECLPFTRRFCFNNENQDRPVIWIRALFNRKLEDMCDRNKWGFLTYPDLITDRDGFLLEEFRNQEADHTVHMEYTMTAGLMIPRLQRLIGAYRG